MQTQSESSEPRLATLLALVTGILCLTGVCVASYLSEDAARQATSGGYGAPAVGCLGCQGTAPAAVEVDSEELPDMASHDSPLPLTRAAACKVRVG
jgi:hypothetical protein